MTEAERGGKGFGRARFLTPGTSTCHAGSTTARPVSVRAGVHAAGPGVMGKGWQFTGCPHWAVPLCTRVPPAGCALLRGMAWRIAEAVLRGEIDNRARGRVTGRIWLAGREEPVELDLAGDARRDLAGRRLEFVNPAPKARDLAGFAARQTGTVGDISASRKVKVPDIPLDQIGEYYAAGKKWTWHWGNSLYLEWFSGANGRVVIESAGYRLTISPDIAWDMTPAEEEAQRQANAEAMGGFMQQLGEAVAAEAGADAETLPDEKSDEWKASRPQTEAEAEKMLADSDRLADRIQARMEREGPEADYEKILEEEIERRARERGDPPPTPEQEARRAEWIEEMNRAAEEALNNPDPELEAELAIVHPVAAKASDHTVQVMRETRKRGWVPDDAGREHPVVELVASTMAAGAKFAGALNGETWPPPVDDCAHKIVRLKRARGHLDDALLAAESCREQRLVDAAWLGEVEGELHGLSQACDELIAELRGRLERGCD